MTDLSTPAQSLEWRASIARDAAPHWHGHSVAELKPYPGTVGEMVNLGLSLLAAGDTPLATLYLAVGVAMGEDVLSNRRWPNPLFALDAPDAQDRQLAADRRAESETCRWLAYAKWLLGDPWPRELAARAADLEVQAHGAQVLRFSAPHFTLQLLAISGQAARGAELYRTHWRASKQLKLPPTSARYAANHLDAVYVVCSHLAGEPGLEHWADVACRRYLQRARAWHPTDPNFHDRERLAWMRLWQAHFGGPQDIAELVAAVRPR